mgnify:CR=1 FL=1
MVPCSFGRRSPQTDEVAGIAKTHVLKALARRAAVRVSPEALEVDDALAAGDPVHYGSNRLRTHSAASARFSGDREDQLTDVALPDNVGCVATTKDRRA